MSSKQGSNYMDSKDAARIQSNEAKNSGTGGVQSGGFAARAQAAAANNQNAGNVQHAGGKSGKK